MTDPRPFVLPLSAETPEGLAELRRESAVVLRSAASFEPAGLLHVAARRRHLGRRAVALGTTREELLAALVGEPAGELVQGDAAAAPAAQTAWLLTDEQPPDGPVARMLLDHVPRLREALERMCRGTRASWDADLLGTLCSSEPRAPPVALALATTAFQLALPELWRAAAGPPALIAGAGPLASLAALAACGALSSDDVLHLVAARRHLEDTQASVGLDELLAIAGPLDWRPLAAPLVSAAGVTIPVGAMPRPEELLAELDDATQARRALEAEPGLRVVQIPPPHQDALGPLRQLAEAYCAGLDVNLAVLLGPPAPGHELPRLPAPPVAAQRAWPEEAIVEVPAPAPRAPPVPPAEPVPPVAEPGDRVETVLRAIVGQAAHELGVASGDVTPEATFFEMGADSLLMVNVVRHVEHAFGVTVGMRELFEEADSPIALARLVEGRMEPADDTAPAVDVPVPEPAPPVEAPSRAVAPPIAPIAPRPHGRLVLPELVSAPPAATRAGHLAWLMQAYTARTRGSKELADRVRPRLADSRASVGFRSATKEMLYPLAARSVAGSRMEDVDGNVYVDVTMGFGTQLFGHDPPFVRAAIEQHLAGGMRLGPRSEDTGAVADLLCEITGAERAAFATSGTEANSAAIRIARAATGRDTVVMFHDAYHGHFDTMLARSSRGGTPRTIPVSSGVPQHAIDDVLVLDYGSDEALETIAAEADRIAAVLVEPVQSRRLDLRPQAFLAELRAITARAGALLVFDELLTGFRAHLRGAQGIFGIEPDISTYGKALGGGLPIGAIVGRREAMDYVDGGAWRYGDDSRPETPTTFFGGTYIQHPLSMATARAILSRLRDAGPALQDGLNARMDRLAARLNASFEEREQPVRVVHFGSQFRFQAQCDLDLLFPHLLLNGVYVWEWRNFFLSTAHDDEDVDRIVAATERSLEALRDAGWTPPAPLRRPTAQPAAPSVTAGKPPRVSLYYFGAYPRELSAAACYETLIENARAADEAGFHALWMPERHFHSFGGIFPNPSVLAAALARETRQIRLHAGSVVLPLHNPIRVAEEWSVVDNLSGGRVGIGVASGWHSNDFALRPEAFGDHKDAMYRELETVKALWSGAAVEVPSGTGEMISVKLHPAPLQPSPPLYTAIIGNPESYARAGAHDLGVITNLLAQDLETLERNVARYRAARADAGLDPAAGSVVVLLHTYLAATEERAREEAHDPFCTYLRSSMQLLGQVASTLGMKVDLASTPAADIDYVLDRAFTSYCDGRALIGTVASCAEVAGRVVAAGADELACFVDFGVSPQQLRSSMPHLVALRDRLTRAAGETAPAAPSPPVEDPAPLSFAQERMWFTERLHQGYRGYNEPQAIRLEGPLDVAALTDAFGDVAREQAMLRCRIVHEAGIPSHRFGAPRPIALPVIDADAAEEDAIVAAEVARESAREFDLAEGPLWLVRLLRFGPERHVLVLSLHHIIFDLVSTRSITRGLSRCYAARLRGEAPPPQANRPYADYVRSQRDAVASPAVRAELDWWAARLAPLPAALELPADRPRPATFCSEGAAVYRTLGADVAAQLEALCRELRVTPFIVLLAGYAAALSGASGQDEPVIGTPIADQPPEFADTIGLFINTLALRIDLSGAATFAEMLSRTRATLLDAQEHATAPFEEVVRRVNPRRDPGRNPIFQASIEFGGNDSHTFDLPGLATTLLDVAPLRSPFDLTLRIAWRRDTILCQFEYATALFEERTIGTIADAFERLMRRGLADPHAALDAGPGPLAAAAGHGR